MDSIAHWHKAFLSEIVQNTLRSFLAGGIIAALSSGIIAARVLPVRSNN